MAQNALPTRDALTNRVARRAIATGDYHREGVDEILFSLDEVCNLDCPGFGGGSPAWSIGLPALL
jgi:hypothetical protein